MWLMFAIKDGSKASIRISKRDYAQLLRRFSVEGAGQGIECPFCEKTGYDCSRCVMVKILSEEEMNSFTCGIRGLNKACVALDRLDDDKRGREFGDHCNKPRHNNSVRTLRNFRRRLIRAARKEKPQCK